MSARVMPFVATEARSAPPFDSPQVLPFLTRKAFARRESNRESDAYIAWLHRQRDPAAPREEPPNGDIMFATFVERSVRLTATARLFETVLRGAAPGPMWRVACWMGRGVDRFCRVLHTAMLVYYTLLGLTAFRLFARAQWVGGIVMATVGSMFGSLLIIRCRPRRRSARLRTQLATDV